MSFVAADGKRVFLFLNIDPQGVVIGWEGQGCYFYDGARSLNRFQLVAAGFDGIVAPTLVAIVNGIISDVSRERQSRTAAIPQRLITAERRMAPSGQED